MPDVDILGEGLLLPEGPVILPDGSVLFVEVLRGTLSRIWGDRRYEVVAELGGGPNGLALGPDGAAYVCNNGGYSWTRDADGRIVTDHGTGASYSGGRIERVDLATGSHERIYEACDGHMLRGPNDIVFDEDGNFWFSDMGRLHGRHRDLSGLYYASPDGRNIGEVVYGGLSFNGVGLAPDQRRLYASDTYNARLWSYDLAGPGELTSASNGQVVGGLAKGELFDSLAVTAAGNICVATLVDGGFTSFSPDGVLTHHALPDPMVTNLCFGGDDMCTAYVTLGSTGRLARLRWPEPGLRLHFNPY